MTAAAADSSDVVEFVPTRYCRGVDVSGGGMSLLGTSQIRPGAKMFEREDATHRLGPDEAKRARRGRNPLRQEG